MYIHSTSNVWPYYNAVIHMLHAMNNIFWLHTVPQTKVVSSAINHHQDSSDSTAGLEDRGKEREGLVIASGQRRTVRKVKTEGGGGEESWESEESEEEEYEEGDFGEYHVCNQLCLQPASCI